MNWHSILFGEEPWNFIFEVIIRSTIMFVVVLISLRLMGQRAIMQGIFEIALIIALGSAGGDAMFYGDVGMIPCILVFGVIIGMYRGIHAVMAKYKRFERFMQGPLLHLIQDGEFVQEALKTDDFGSNEIYSDLRLKNVSHLGQVKHAYIEPSGALSVFFFPDEDVRYGLPILPRKLDEEQSIITTGGHYSCARCGHTSLVTIDIVKQYTCDTCRHEKCLKAINTLRLS